MDISNVLLKFLVFIFFYLLLSSLAELVIAYNTNLKELDLVNYIFSIILSFCLTLLLKIKKNNIKVNQFSLVISDKLLLIVSIFSFIWFLFFVSKNVSSFSGLVNFAYQYRNGFLQGSGIYTAPILTLVPAILVLIIVKQKKLSKAVLITFLLVLTATIIVGLRIYLFGIIFSYIIRLFYSSSYKKILIILSIFGLIMMSFKFYLNEDTKDFSNKQTAFYFLGRLNLRTLLDFPGFEKDFSDFKCAVFPINYFNDCTNANFKELFIQGNEDIYKGMSYIGSYSGIALPLTVILYNTFGFICFIFITWYILFLLNLYKLVLKSKNIVTSSIILNLSIILTSALVEDINILNKIPLMLIVCFMYSFGIKHSNLFKHKKIKSY